MDSNGDRSVSLKVKRLSDDRSISFKYFFDNVVFWVLCCTVLIPLIFAGSSDTLFQVVKIAVLTSVGLFVFLWALVRIIRSGNFTLPSKTIIFPVSIVFLVYVISSIFSRGSFWVSAFGYVSEPMTLGFVFLMLVLMIAVGLEFRKVSRILAAHFALLISAFLLSVFHISRIIFGVDFLSFGIFTNLSANTIGSWSELAIFFGLSTIVSALVLEIFDLKSYYKWFLLVVWFLSIAMLVVVNFYVVWLVLVFFSLILALLLSGVLPVFRNFCTAKIPWHFVCMFVISIFFIFPFSGQYLSDKLQDIVQVASVDIRPSWAGTFDVAKESLSKNPVWGAGPNRFAVEWESYRPDINSTDFWTNVFTTGSGLIPTAMIETGLAGIISWILFVGLFFWIILKTFNLRKVKPEVCSITTLSAVPVVYLWILNIIYVPNTSLIYLTFFFSGILISSAIISGVLSYQVINFSDKKKIKLVIIMLSLLISVGLVNWGFVFGKKIYAYSFFDKGSKIFSTNSDTDAAYRNIISALSLDQSDLYYRMLSNIKLFELNEAVRLALLGDQVDEKIRLKFERDINIALEASLGAKDSDPENFLNWLFAARAYTLMTRVAIPDSYENASSNYDRAIKLSPKNPGIYLERASLELINKDQAKAKEYVLRSLELKPNFSDALAFLTNLYSSEGDTASALTTAQKRVSFNPNEPSALFDLGLLYYGEKDWTNAARILEDAIRIIPEYSNARYFLGLCYYNLDRIEEAISQFKILAELNPENGQVRKIIENIQSNSHPLLGIEQ